jgi:hypothetical protein
MPSWAFKAATSAFKEVFSDSTNDNFDSAKDNLPLTASNSAIKRNTRVSSPFMSVGKVIIALKQMEV